MENKSKLPTVFIILLLAFFGLYAFHPLLKEMYVDIIVSCCNFEDELAAIDRHQNNASNLGEKVYRIARAYEDSATYHKKFTLFFVEPVEGFSNKTFQAMPGVSYHCEACGGHVKLPGQQDKVVDCEQHQSLKTIFDQIEKEILAAQLEGEKIDKVTTIAKAIRELPHFTNTAWWKKYVIGGWERFKGLF